MKNKKCECPNEAKSKLGRSWFRAEEYKAMSHKAGKCPGDFELATYNRDDNTSIIQVGCHLPGDVKL